MAMPQSEADVGHISAGDGGHHSISITGRRDGKTRTWSGEGKTVPDAVRGAVEKMLNDPRTGEFLP